MIGEKFSGKIRALTFKGLGVVDHPEGRVFFVRGTWPGDEGLFEVESVEKRFGFAKLINLHKPSGNRRDPPCPHLGFEAGKCGGCPWMIATYESQSEEKENILKQLLIKSKVSMEEDALKPIAKSPSEFGYRNRAQFKTDGKRIGYISANTNTLAAIDNCLVLTPKNQKTFQSLKRELPNSDWEPQGKFDFNFIDIDDNSENYLLNSRLPFRQGNSEQNTFMREWVSGQLKDLDKSQEILELFCGSGNFTEVISEAGFSKIVASEISGEAMKELKGKNLNGVIPIEANIFKPDSWKVLKRTSDPEVLFLDPPRDGFKEFPQFLKVFRNIKSIIYISCDASTFIRDCKEIEKLGYKIKELVPLDQFPQTPHLEILSVLELCD